MAADKSESAKALAQRLHDTVCQELTGIGFLAVAAAHQHRGRDPQVEAQFREIADLVQSAGAHLVEIVRGLRAAE